MNFFAKRKLVRQQEARKALDAALENKALWEKMMCAQYGDLAAAIVANPAIYFAEAHDLNRETVFAEMRYRQVMGYKRPRFT